MPAMNHAAFRLGRSALGRARSNLPSRRKPTPSAWRNTNSNPNSPAELKGKLPTAKQLADAMKGEMGRMK